MAAVLLILLFMLCLPGCSNSNKVSCEPNVILITIDTLRADHLSCYSCARETSPYIDLLAKQGTLFTNAYSTSSWTSPSMASIFTGLHPRSHGVIHGKVLKGKKKIVNQELLLPRFLTIAEVLKKAGYRTFGVSANPHMSPETGFDQGFDYFKTMWEANDAPAVNNVVERWKEEIQKAPKYFLWVHYLDPHVPYYAHEPWIKAYSADHSSYVKWAGVLVNNRTRRHLARIRKDSKARQALLDLYDSEINYCDHHLHDLITTLALERNSLIIITSDHGEEFLEHGGLSHGRTLYEEVVKVPLVIKLPDDGHVIKEVDRPVSNKDIFPTILDVLRIDVPPNVGGRSLLPLIETLSQKDLVTPIYTELDRGRDWKSVRRNSWKFMIKNTKDRFLFNLQTDPYETMNLLLDKPDIARELEIELNEWMNAHPPLPALKNSSILNKDKEEKLHSLGYL